MLDLIGAVHQLIDVDGLGPYRWPPLSPDWAVNLHGRGPQSRRLLHIAQPRRLMAFAWPEAGHHTAPEWRQDEHEVRRWCRLLAWYGIVADPDDLALRRPPAQKLPIGVTIVHWEEAERIGHELSAAVTAIATRERFTCRSW
ncbi:hypothetical protein PSH03_002583 [Micromonospora sp. PSH03]|uniref:hypothetical protein n=1 Tax=Micromonospora TaxID=1873 RepID=UPI001B38822B|nr:MULTISPECIES: hypothetical protein [Micromonospora]MBQ0991030.1 hypothetical protein [Micromonospora sp. H61]MCG5457473.1 hypothetical protein [Micromonospora salmantinae]